MSDGKIWRRLCRRIKGNRSAGCGPHLSGELRAASREIWSSGLRALSDLSHPYPIVILRGVRRPPNAGEGPPTTAQRWVKQKAFTTEDTESTEAFEILVLTAVFLAARACDSRVKPGELCVCLCPLWLMVLRFRRISIRVPALLIPGNMPSVVLEQVIQVLGVQRIGLPVRISLHRLER